jgi:hypothetical protein
VSEPGHEDEEIQLANRASDLLSTFFHEDQQAMVVKWAMQVELIDSNGKSSLWTLSMPGMAMWERMGFMRYALAYQDGLLAESIRRGDDDD